jgi:hypothetical protein
VTGNYSKYDSYIDVRHNTDERVGCRQNPAQIFEMAGRSPCTHAAKFLMDRTMISC